MTYLDCWLPQVRFVDYTFAITSEGNIVMDSELMPEQIQVKAGDKFEVVLAPGIGIVFKKINDKC